MARFVLPIWQLVNDDASSVAAGWKLNFYSTGTTTRKDTFSDTGLATANANPVVADSAGRFGPIFLESGTYKVILTDESDVQKWSADPVEGAVGNTGAVDEITSAYTVTIADSTKLLAVDATSAAVTISLPAAATAGDGFEITVKKVDSSANAVTVDPNGSETIDGAATAVLSSRYATATVRSDGQNWQISDRGYVVDRANAFSKTQTFAKGADVASATALTLGTDGNYFDITGTTTIATIGSLGVGTVVKLHFDGALTLTHSADLVLPYAADIVTRAGDEAEFVEYASGDWRMTNFQTATRGIVDYGYASSAAVATGTTTIPNDNSIPQNTEGDEYMTLAYTPKYSNTTLEIEFMGQFAVASSAQNITVALFRDSGADALAAVGNYTTASQSVFCLRHRMASPGTSATTFKIRAGGTAGNTVTFNGSGGTRAFGGVSASNLRVTEFFA